MYRRPDRERPPPGWPCHEPSARNGSARENGSNLTPCASPSVARTGKLGRWTAKHAVAACLQLPADLPSLASIEVRPGPSGAPETFLGNKWAPVTISLSHRAGRAVCAVAPDGGALGCDLEVIEPHSDAFIADYFATEEQALVARAAPADRPGLVTLLWSAKESALKALRAGLRLDTRSCDRHSRRCATEPKRGRRSVRARGGYQELGFRRLAAGRWSMAGVLCAFVTSMIKPSWAGGNTPGTSYGRSLLPRHRRARAFYIPCPAPPLVLRASGRINLQRRERTSIIRPNNSPPFLPARS